MTLNEIEEIREVLQAAEAIKANIRVGIDQMNKGQNILADTHFQIATNAYMNLRKRLLEMVGHE